MRFMMLMIPKGYESAPPGTMPDPKAVEAMLAYNQALQRAGVLLALDGLHPPSAGARVTFEGGAPQVRRGPFPEAGEVLGGYWMIQVESLDEAIAWALRCPLGLGTDNVLDIRPLTEMTDIPPDLLALSRKVAPAWTASVSEPRTRQR